MKKIFLAITYCCLSAVLCADWIASPGDSLGSHRAIKDLDMQNHAIINVNGLTIVGDVNMSSANILHVASITANQISLTDNVPVSSSAYKNLATGSDRVQKAGDTMTGELMMSSSNILAVGSITVNQIDAQLINCSTITTFVLHTTTFTYEVGVSSWLQVDKVIIGTATVSGYLSLKDTVVMSSSPYANLLTAYGLASDTGAIQTQLTALDSETAIDTNTLHAENNAVGLTTAAIQAELDALESNVSADTNTIQGQLSALDSEVSADTNTLNTRLVGISTHTYQKFSEVLSDTNTLNTTKVAKAGDTMTGDLILSSANLLQVATFYVNRVAINDKLCIGNCAYDLNNMIGLNGETITSSASMSMTYYRNGTAATNSANLNIRAANGTAASPTKLLSGDKIMAITGTGYGATAWGTNSVGIAGYSEGDLGSATQQPARLSFETQKNGDAARTERMRISSTGTVTMYYDLNLASSNLVAGATITANQIILADNVAVSSSPYAYLATGSDRVLRAGDTMTGNLALSKNIADMLNFSITNTNSGGQSRIALTNGAGSDQNLVFNRVGGDIGSPLFGVAQGSASVILDLASASVGLLFGTYYANQPIYFGTANTERMRIHAGGGISVVSSATVGTELISVGTMTVTNLMRLTPITYTPTAIATGTIYGLDTGTAYTVYICTGWAGTTPSLGKMSLLNP